MGNYNESSVSGTKYQRCNQVIISNPYNGVPTITMQEELVATTDIPFTKQLPGLTFGFYPSEVIPMINPITGDPIQGVSITGAEVYAAIYSYYIKKAIERDNG